MTHFVIHSSGPNGVKFDVNAIPSQSPSALWDGVNECFIRPCPEDMEAFLPYRWRKAWERAGRHFWFDKHGGIDADTGRYTGTIPHITLLDRRGKFLTTLYAIPSADFNPRAMSFAHIKPE